MCSWLFATVFDVHQKAHAVIGERRRTNANETEIETEIETAREGSTNYMGPQEAAAATCHAGARS
jgi:hypothetical protein